MKGKGEDRAVPENHSEAGVTRHLAEKATWLRLIFMILFGIVVEILRFAVYLVAVVQFLFKLFTGKDQPQIRALGGSLAEYLRQIVDFLAFRSEDRPYPWGIWPMPDRPPAGAPAAGEAPPVKTSIRRGTRGGRRKSGGEGTPTE